MQKILLTNELGPEILAKLSPDAVVRLEGYLNHPDARKWNDIHGLTISHAERTYTVWQWVNVVEPSFADVPGPIESLNHGRIRGWERIPEPEIVLEAIRQGVTRW